MIANEGYIKEGTKIYNDKYEIINEFYSDTNIRVDTEIKDLKNNTYYYFTGIAGATGYIRKEDFFPNPFR